MCTRQQENPYIITYDVYFIGVNKKIYIFNRPENKGLVVKNFMQ